MVMRLQTQKQSGAQQSQSVSTGWQRQTLFAGNHGWTAILDRQSIDENQTVCRSPGFSSARLETISDQSVSRRFSHNFGQIPIFSKSDTRIQAKLAIGEPNDAFEQEADRVATRVLRMPEPQLQRACDCGGACPSCQGDLQRSEHDRVRTKSVDGSRASQIVAPPIVGEVLSSSGQPLDAATRAFFEPRFGHDFGRVRIHTGAHATESARAVNALAFTVGYDIVMGAGQFAPAMPAGRRLLAHELTHVLQQGEARDIVSSSSNKFGPTRSDNRGPTEPTGSEVEAMGSRRVSSIAPVLQRFLTVSDLSPRTENLAERVVAGRSTAGFVAYWLNNRRIDAKPGTTTAAQIQADLEAAGIAAIRRPEVGSRLYDVEGPHGPELHGDGWIKSVPNNVLEVEAHWLTPPPWTAVTTKGVVGKEFYLGMCIGADPCTLTVNGIPDDVTLAAGTQEHESQHAKDIIAAFNAVFKPWDERMTLAWDSGEVFSGLPKQVNADLWHFLGGAPEEIAKKFVAEVERLGKLLHAGLDEPKMHLKNNKAGPECNAASIDAEGGK